MLKGGTLTSTTEGGGTRKRKLEYGDEGREMGKEFEVVCHEKMMSIYADQNLAMPLFWRVPLSGSAHDERRLAPCTPGAPARHPLPHDNLRALYEGNSRIVN